MKITFHGTASCTTGSQHLLEVNGRRILLDRDLYQGRRGNLPNLMKRSSVFGDEFDVHARIEILDSFSGHADHTELMDYSNQISGPKKNVFLVHGEPERSRALLDSLISTHPTSNIAVAQPY